MEFSFQSVGQLTQLIGTYLSKSIQNVFLLDFKHNLSPYELLHGPHLNLQGSRGAFCVNIRQPQGSGSR